MKDLNTIGEELFDKLRGRFQSVTIGGEDGKVTNIPTEARFFDFEYTANGNPMGNISVSISEDDGLTVIFSRDIVANEEDETVKSQWFDFLKELRRFSKKRLMDFDIRDITKSNLTKRDYKFLANKRFGDDNMNESKLYGTARTSYQKVGEARIMIKHTENVNLEATNPRTKKIANIYIESAQGERFKYPFKHLSGARAMARHVAEGGNLYDDFGSHIIGLSEEMAKLRKFKSYMGRSAVMAESLSEYVDVVKERISTVRKTITSLQKPKFYAETFAAYEKPIMEEVPADVAENWTDQLTIKQFNEELADVFPYIYKLVSEATKAVEVDLDDLDESGLQYYTGVKKHGKEYMKKAAAAGRKGASQEELGRLKDKHSKAEKTKEDIAVEQGFEEMMGQFAESPQGQADGEMKRDKAASLSRGEVKAQRKSTRAKQRVANKKVAKDAMTQEDMDYINNAQDVEDSLGKLRGLSKKFQTNDADAGKVGVLAAQYVSRSYAAYEWLQTATNDFQTAPKLKQPVEAMIELRGVAKSLSQQGEDPKMEERLFPGAVVETLWNVILNVRKANSDGAFERNEAGEEKDVPEKPEIPLGEFILSYYDKDTGQFPKGETAILTMVEKDYGERFIDPAKQFISDVTAKFEQWQMQQQPQQMEVDADFDRIRELAGLR